MTVGFWSLMLVVLAFAMLNLSLMRSLRQRDHAVRVIAQACEEAHAQTENILARWRQSNELVKAHHDAAIAGLVEAHRSHVARECRPLSRTSSPRSRVWI